MDIKLPFDVNLSDWAPPELNSLSLPQYLTSREAQFLSSETGVADWHNYQIALERHFSRLEIFLAGNDLKFQNLVFGNIQSGKTAHLLANICWAKDHGLDLVILFSGSTTPLNDQTRERLISDLPLGTGMVESVPTESSESQLIELCLRLRQQISLRAGSIYEPIPVLVMLKNPNRLAAMEYVLSDLQNRFPDALKVMIVDDEADQASPDASLRKKKTGTTSSKVRKPPRTTHLSIGNLTDVISGKRIYLSYTATPQALLHGELSNNIHPQFCSVIPAGSEYVGIAEVVAASKVLVTTQEMTFSSEAMTDIEVNQRALESCFAEFMILSWLHKEYPEVFHGQKNSENPCSLDSVQMLIHPSSAQSEHRDYAADVMELVRSWVEDLSSLRNREMFLQLIFGPAYLRIAARIQSPFVEEFLSESSYENCLTHVFNTLKIQGLLEVKQVNSNTRAGLKREGREKDFLPNKPAEWKNKDWILIGGDILGRGLTIPHLTITFFLRNPNQPNFDIALQQMRFCGYRKNYLQLTRVCAPTDVVADYKDASVIERLLRKRATTWDENGRDLLKDKPLIRFESPTVTRYRPTRNAVTSVDIVTKDVGNSGFFGFRTVANRSRFLINRNFVIDFLGSSVGGRTSADLEYFGMSAADALNFLSSMSVADRDKSDFLAFLELLGYGSDEYGFGNDEIKFVFDLSLRAILETDMLDNVREPDLKSYKYGRSILRSQYLDSNKWLNGDPKSNFAALDDFQIQTLVGTPERKVPDLFPDQVVIHFRVFALWRDAQTKIGPIGWGFSLIGWTPVDGREIWIHEGAL